MLPLVSNGPGDQACRSTEKVAPRRTTFHRGDRHVGTVVEYIDTSNRTNDFCLWYSASGGGRTATYSDALHRMTRAR